MSYLYRLKYRKNGPLKFISHLDLNSLFRRTLLRAKIPVELTEGFNPRIKVSFGPALPLGIEGWQEIMEISLVEPLAKEILVDKINKAAPPGLKVIKALELLPQKVSLSKLLKGASYLIYFIFENHIEINKKRYHQDRFESVITDLLKQREIISITEAKKGIMKLDLRPFLQEIGILTRKNNRLVVRLIINLEQGRSLNPYLIINKIVERTNGSVIIDKIVREKFVLNSIE